MKSNRTRPERIECRVTAKEKSAIYKKAKKFKQTVTEHLVSASAAYGEKKISTSRLHTVRP